MLSNLKEPQGIRVGYKGIRGLGPKFNVIHPITSIVGIALDVPIVESPEISLRPGEEITTIVRLTEDILGDVDFIKITAALLPQAEDASLIQLTQKSTIIEDNRPPRTINVDIAVPAEPTNLSLRLKGGDVFWTNGNTLTAGKYNLPDIAGPVNKYLDGIQMELGSVDIPIELPFLVRSSSSGKVKIGIYDIEYVRLKTESWHNKLDDTERVDRNLSLGFAQVESIRLESIENNDELTLDKIRLDLGGEFGPERLLGRIEQHDNNEFATIDHEYALAQGLMLETPIQCVGLSAPFYSEAEAEFYIEILNDEDGSPAATASLAGATVTLPVPKSDNNRQWTYINFDTPVDLEVDVPYWVVIKGIRSRILLALMAQKDTYLTNTLVNRGGQLWKPLHGNQSLSLPLLRLVYLPEIDNQSAAITLRLQKTNIRRPFDPLPEAQNVTLQPSSDISLPLILVVESQGQGILNLANIIQEYQPKK